MAELSLLYSTCNPLTQKISCTNREISHTYLYMLMAFIYEPFVYLITEAQGVMFDAEICNPLQLAPTEYLGVEECFRILKRHFETKCNICDLTFPIGLLGVLMMIALVLELNLLASSSWSRTQSALLRLVVAVDFYHTCQSSVMFHGNMTNHYYIHNKEG